VVYELVKVKSLKVNVFHVTCCFTETMRDWAIVTGEHNLNRNLYVIYQAILSHQKIKIKSKKNLYSAVYSTDSEAHDLEWR